MSGERDAGFARRRRERRLRSWLRHERMTVAAELSEALHHNRDGGARAVRWPTGTEVGQLSRRGGVGERDARSPAGTDHSTSRGSAGASCGGCRAAGVDCGTLPGRRWADPDRAGLGWQGGRGGGTPLPSPFFLSQSLLAEQEAKEAEELEANLAAWQQQLLEEVERLRTSPTRGARGSPVEAAAAWWSLAKLATRKKKSKRRRKKKLPRGGSRLRMVLLREKSSSHYLVRQWYLFCVSLREVLLLVARGHYFYGPLHLAAFSSARRPQSTKSGIFWDIPSRNVLTFSAFWFDCGYILRKFTEAFGSFHAGSHLPSPMRWLPRSSSTTVVWLGFAGDDAFCAVLPFIVLGPERFGILAGMTLRGTVASRSTGKLVEQGDDATIFP